MPCKDRVQRSAYASEWIRQRRTDWFSNNGPCKICGSADRLELDHIDPLLKITHNVWSWSEVRRIEELYKCQVLCYKCHKEKTKAFLTKNLHGTTSKYNIGKCRCELCKSAYAVATAKYWERRRK